LNKSNSNKDAKSRNNGLMQAKKGASPIRPNEFKNNKNSNNTNDNSGKKRSTNNLRNIYLSDDEDELKNNYSYKENLVVQ